MTDLPRFDVSEFIDTPEAEDALLSDAFDSGDLGYITHALGIIARARGMSQVARNAGVTRQALYTALSGSGDPRLSTLLGVMGALGLKLRVERPAA
jgi:probable addiction module antidote protein